MSVAQLHARTERKLDHEAERRLVLAAIAGGEDERSELIEALMPLIASVARLYRGSPAVDRSELLQEGVVGLLRALRRFDPDAGTSFRAYASWWIRQAMQQLTAELSRPFVLSDRALRQLAQLKGAQHRHLRSCGREATVHELADATGIAADQVERLLAAARQARALDEPVGDESGAATLAELLPDPTGEDPGDGAVRHVAVEGLPRLLGKLNARERHVIGQRFGLGVREHTLREIGDDIGVSVERVRQIEQASLIKLRAASGDREPV
jgi:RNA polymerase sigma factor (sigma-70 family)